MDLYLRVVEDGLSVFGAKSVVLGRAVFNAGSLYYSLCDLVQARRYLEWSRDIFLYQKDEQAMEEIIDRAISNLNQADQPQDP